MPRVSKLKSSDPRFLWFEDVVATFKEDGSVPEDGALAEGVRVSSLDRLVDVPILEGTRSAVRYKKNEKNVLKLKGTAGN